MDASRYLTCLWPGLSELWYRGRWSALPAAVAFAVVLNFLLVARFIYPEWLAPSLVRLACWVGVAAWFVLAFRAAGRLPWLLQPRAAAEQPDRYPEARSGYLQARWADTEAVLAACLELDPRDCQSLLLLASVYRHTKRFEAAEHALRQLDRLETADGWWLEREAERKRLERDRLEAESPPDAEPNADPAADADSAPDAAGSATIPEAPTGSEPTGAPAASGPGSGGAAEPVAAKRPRPGGNPHSAQEDSPEGAGLAGPRIAVSEATDEVSRTELEQERETGEPQGGEPGRDAAAGHEPA